MKTGRREVKQNARGLCDEEQVGKNLTKCYPTMSDGCGCFYMGIQRRGFHYCPLARSAINRERVKFGTPLDDVCKGGIPGSLLVLILKLNAEGPYKKEIFRAPGNCSMVKKLTQVMREGHSVNLQGYSVHTVASVLKIFLQRLPDGIFGRPREQQLFRIMELDDVERQKEGMSKVISSLSPAGQQLLVLVIGMFRLIASMSERARTGMSAEALGVSVAPSLLHSCVSNGKHVRMEDVENFKVASRVLTFLIEHFGSPQLFTKDNYEFFSTTTRRLVRTNGRWSFRVKCHPPLKTNISGDSDSESHLKTKGSLKRSSPLPEKDLMSCPELITCGQQIQLLTQAPSEESAPKTAKTVMDSEGNVDTENLSVCDTPVGGESLSLYDLPEVHSRQTERMRARSEWFLTPTRHHGALPHTRIPLTSIDWNGVKQALDASTRSPSCDSSAVSSPRLHPHLHYPPPPYHPSPNLLTPSYTRRGFSTPPDEMRRASSPHTTMSTPISKSSDNAQEDIVDKH